MTAEQIEAAIVEGMHAQTAPVVILDDEDYTYAPVGQERLLLQGRITELEARLADVGAYGADQWRRGHRGKDPQEFDEWRALER